MATLRTAPFDTSQLIRPVWILTSVMLTTTLKDVTLAVSGLDQSSLHDVSDVLQQFDLSGVVVGVFSQQFNATTSYSSDHPATLRGLFPSEVRINFHGEPTISTLRNSHVVHDLSSLATTLTLNALIEAAVKGQLEGLPTNQLSLALRALGSFRSPSFGESRSGLTAFWPVQATGPSQTWRTRSVNAVQGGHGLVPFTILNTAVNGCGANACPQGRNSRDTVQNNTLCLTVFNQSLSQFAERHNLPPDVTSSFANLALGAVLLLGSYSDQLSLVFQEWSLYNANFSRLIQHAGQFSYRPLSADVNSSVIDSRTYFSIRQFLYRRNRTVLENDLFITNWIPQSRADGRLQYGPLAQPGYNIIDLFGTATFLHAVTTAVLTNLTACDSDVQAMVRSNLDLVKWVVSNGNGDDLDLVTSTHPSRFQFYWMLSRAMFELESARIQMRSTYVLLREFYPALNATVRHYVTEAILTAIQDGGLDNAGNPLAYVDDIIGISDVNEEGNTQPSGADRVFATASAVNSLLAAWTVLNGERRLQFLPDTPDDVALATQRLVNYVTDKCMHDDVSLANVIRTPVVKNCQSLPYWFPSTHVTNLTGANFTGSNPTPEIIFGVRGITPPTEDEYEALLQQPRFGHTFSGGSGLNGTSAMSLYWSSPVFTKSLCLLAMAQMKNTRGKADSEESLINSFRTRGN